MDKFSYDEAFRMVSLFKGQIRSVKDETPQIMEDNSLTYDEKLIELRKIEIECIDSFKL